MAADRHGLPSHLLARHSPPLSESQTVRCSPLASKDWHAQPMAARPGKPYWQEKMDRSLISPCVKMGRVGLARKMAHPCCIHTMVVSPGNNAQHASIPSLSSPYRSPPTLCWPQPTTKSNLAYTSGNPPMTDGTGNAALKPSPPGRLSQHGTNQLSLPLAACSSGNNPINAGYRNQSVMDKKEYYASSRMLRSSWYKPPTPSTLQPIKAKHGHPPMAICRLTRF